MYGYENNKNSPVYRYTTTAPKGVIITHPPVLKFPFHAIVFWKMEEGTDKLCPHRHSVYQGDRRRRQASFSRLFGRPKQQRTTNNNIQKTDAYRQTAWRIILQPDFPQSYDYQDIDKTSATCLQHTGQFIWRKQVPWPCFWQKQLQHWLY